MKNRTLPALPTTNLSLMERLYKWGVIWVLLFIIFFAVHSNQNYLFRLASSSCFVGMVVLLVTIINKVLIAYMLKKNRLVLFILSSVFAIPLWSLASISLDACLLHFIVGEPFADIFEISRFVLSYLVRLVWFITIYALAVIFYYQRKEDEEKVISDKLKSEKLDMELRYLKSQINPHFLFNALNNIYSMVYTHDDNAADGVLKLSEMLRYVLVDCQADMIPLNKEVKYVENFIDFQMMRMEGDRDVVLDKDIENENFMIAPMLLQPIVENCFKYSRLESHPDGYVHLNLKQQGNQFVFEACNTLANKGLGATETLFEKKNGIGQKNVQKRLMLHYGENYHFDIEQNPDYYKVTIKL